MRPDHVPVRTILATIGLVLATVVAVELIVKLPRILIWLVVAVFVAVVFAPAVGWVQRRLDVRRTVATFVVFMLGLLLLLGIGAAFVIPLTSQVQHIATSLPNEIQQAQNGRGPVVDVLRRMHLFQFVQSYQAALQGDLTQLGAPALSFAMALINTVAGVATVFVLAYLMVLQGPRLVDSALDDRFLEHGVSLTAIAGGECP